MNTEMTHTQLVRRIANWLKAGGRCGGSQGWAPTCKVVCAELHTLTSETPDVIGWTGGSSVLIECKISRSDFHADKNKLFRKFEEQGMGDYRFFAAPEGILTPDDMPDGWGLIEARKRIHQLKPCIPKAANKRCEVTMLVSVLRRLQLSTAVYVAEENPTPASNAEGDTEEKP